MSKQLFILSLIVFTLSSCQSYLTVHKNKVERAKRKINKIVLQYPELKTLSDSTVVTRDTVIENKTYVHYDTITTKKEVFDSTLYFKMDSTYNLQQGNIEAVLRFYRENNNNKLEYKIIKIPEYIAYRDTIYLQDTTVNTNTTTSKTEVIDTKPDFWWNLWSQVKGWLWVILVAIIVIVLIRIVFKFLK